MHKSITDSFKNIKWDGEKYKAQTDKAIANLSASAGRTLEIFRKGIESIMQCQERVMIPRIIMRSRQCKNPALKDKNFCYMHDPSTEEKREQKKTDTFMKKSKLYKAYLLAKSKRKM